MFDRKIYAPAEFKDFLTCSRVKSIAEYIDEFDSNYGDEIDLYFENERKDFYGDFFSYKDPLSILLKGHIIITKSELIKETDSGSEVVYLITKESIHEVKDFFDSFESDDEYLYQELSASLYLTDITITDKETGATTRIKGSDDNLSLIRGFEFEENEALGEYAKLKKEVFDHAFKNINAYSRSIVSQGYTLSIYRYLEENPCKMCKDPCSDYGDKPVEIEWGWKHFKPSDINREMVLEYIYFLKSEIQKATELIINHRKEKGRIDYYTVMTACSFEVHQSRYFGAIAYCNAVNELGLKINSNVLKDKIIGRGFFPGEGEPIDFQNFIDFGNSFGIDVIAELDVPKSILKLFHESKKKLD